MSTLDIRRLAMRRRDLHGAAAALPRPRKLEHARNALRLLMAALVSWMASGLFAVALARPNVPGPPAEVPAAPPAAAPAAPPGGAAPRAQTPPAEARGNWRNLTPAQREAMRQQLREQHEALAGRPGARPAPGAPGTPAPPGGRMSPQERRELRAVIREEHERNRRRP